MSECKHGQLARQCPLCERDQRIAELEAELAELQEQRDELLSELREINDGNELDDWLSSASMPFAAAKDLREMGQTIAKAETK